MKIVYRPHLKRRLRERDFPENYPRKIYIQSKLHFFDNQTDHYVAILKLKYAGKVRNLAITYDIIDRNIEIITIHPVLDRDIKQRTKIGRWKNHEKD